MQILLQAPSDTLIYMIAGYSAIFGGMLIYIISLIIRKHDYLRELEALKKRKEIVL